MTDQATQPNYDIDELIANAMGQKPVGVQQSFHNAAMQKVSDLIAGKRTEVAQDMFGDKAVGVEEPVEEPATSMTAAEVDDALDAIEAEIDVEDSAEEEQEQEEGSDEETV